MTQAVLPGMRRRRAGRILNITSMGGYVTFPGIGAYHGSKFALEGMSEALDNEVKGFGIRVTAVAPGGFRTDWAGRSMVMTERTISDYDEISSGSRDRLTQRNGRQPGDPKKAARAMLDVIAAPNPPQHILLGSDAMQLVGDKLKRLAAEHEAWKAISLSTDYVTG